MKTVEEKYQVNGYYPTIGIECHVQLKTNTKLFAGVDNDARNARQNTLISHICFGLPGALPVLNERAVELAIKAAFALNTRPQQFSKFDRKHYFYPDLPLGYQISQFDEPIILGGHIDITIDGEQRRIGITRAHLEADAGKSTHPTDGDYSLVDLNRAGTPLLEIVSEPDMHSSSEARAYAKELFLAMKYADVSDVDLYHGNMRFDVNVSVSKIPSELGTRSETKNLNSFRSVERAVDYEIARQIEVLESGGEVVQETRGWDDDAQKTFSQRSKEDAHDYRYFPDPDLPPIYITDDKISEAKSNMTSLPREHRKLMTDLGIDSAAIETIIAEPNAARYLSGIRGDKKELVRIIANWFSGPVLKLANDHNYQWTDIVTREWNELAAMHTQNKVSSTGAKEIIAIMLEKGGSPSAIAEEKGLLQVSDEGAIEEIVNKVIANNQSAADDVRSGEMKAIGFLVGQVMKESQGKANPAMAKEMLQHKLSS